MHMMRYTHTDWGQWEKAQKIQAMPSPYHWNVYKNRFDVITSYQLDDCIIAPSLVELHSTGVFIILPPPPKKALVSNSSRSLETSSRIAHRYENMDKSYARQTKKQRGERLTKKKFGKNKKEQKNALHKWSNQYGPKVIFCWCWKGAWKTMRNRVIIMFIKCSSMSIYVVCKSVIRLRRCMQSVLCVCLYVFKICWAQITV